MTSKKLRVGDKIIKCNRVYRIFKINIKKIADKLETIIFYRPYFKDKYNKKLIVSIPFTNLERANIRLPMSKKELSGFFKELSQRSKTNLPVDVVGAKEALNLNDPYQNMELLKRLMIEKRDETVNFTNSKQEVFKQAMEQLVEEIAFVSGLSLVQAERKILNTLNHFN
jgi:RNA polymerase-interacting CarD/CdnL/TRCF family regulator